MSHYADDLFLFTPPSNIYTYRYVVCVCSDRNYYSARVGLSECGVCVRVGSGRKTSFVNIIYNNSPRKQHQYAFDEHETTKVGRRGLATREAVDIRQRIPVGYIPHVRR